LKTIGCLGVGGSACMPDAEHTGVLVVYL